MEGKESSKDARKMIDALGYTEAEEKQPEPQPEAKEEEEKSEELPESEEKELNGKEEEDRPEPEAKEEKKKRGRPKKDEKTSKPTKKKEAKPVVVKAITEFSVVLNGCMKKYTQGQIEGDYITAKYLLDSKCPVSVIGAQEFSQCPNCKYVYK